MLEEGSQTRIFINLGRFQGAGGCLSPLGVIQHENFSV